MSAAAGHHFAGPSNRFWKLLYDSGLVSERITHEDDVRLPEWGLGLTNLIARPSPGIDDLKPREYIDGWLVLEEKIAQYRPAIVAFVGVTMYRALWKVLGQARIAPAIQPGFQHATVHGARTFVLPNPSGRNANFTYHEMLAAFRALRRARARVGSAFANATVGPPKPLRRGGGASEGRSPSTTNVPRQGRPSSAGGASATRAARGSRKSAPTAGRATQTIASPPVAAPRRREPRRRGGSQS